MEIGEALYWRYATKQFDPEKKIPAGDWELLKETMRLSPSSFGLQPWKIYLVNSPGLRSKLRPHTWNQPQVEDCSHYVVIASLKKLSPKILDEFLSLVAKERGMQLSALEGYRQMMEGSIMQFDPPGQDAWAARQAYILMGFLLLSASAQKIDACPIEGLSPDDYDQVLSVDPDYHTVAAVALGYRAEGDKYAQAPKVRFAKDRVFVEC